jgi:RES domain-containing protein
MHDPALVDLLAEAPAGNWTGRAWRHMFAEYPPDRVNTTGARWNPPGVGAIYVSLSRDGALSEARYRLESEPRPIRVKQTLYELEISLHQVLDLSSEGSLGRLGIGIAELQSRDMTACRRVGYAAEFLEHDGLIVPSARHSGQNLVIFDRHRRLTCRFETVNAEVIQDAGVRD